MLESHLPQLIALLAVLATGAQIVHRVCLTIERTRPGTKAAQIAEDVDAVVTDTEAVAEAVKEELPPKP